MYFQKTKFILLKINNFFFFHILIYFIVDIKFNRTPEEDR